MTTMPLIAFAHNLNKKQHGRVHKPTMNLVLQDITSSYSMFNYVFSPIYLFIYFPCLPFATFPFPPFYPYLFIYVDSLPFLFILFTSSLPFIPFPPLFFSLLNQLHFHSHLVESWRDRKKKSAICKCIVFIIYSFFHKRLWFKNKMKVLHLPRSLKNMVFLQKKKREYYNVIYISYVYIYNTCIHII